MKTRRTDRPAKGDKKPDTPAAAHRRADRLFAALTGLILTAGIAGTVGVMGLVSTPDPQVDSFAALPVYNVIGQRTDRVEFWPRARYHDLARATGYPMFFGPQQALEESRAWGLLFPLMSYSIPINTLVAMDQDSADGMGCYSYQNDTVRCRFYDDIPVRITYGSGEEYSIYQGILNVSVGKGLTDSQSCYTALVTPADSMPAATEDQYRKAYQTILDHLLELAGGRDVSPYYSDGPLLWIFMMMGDTVSYELPQETMGEAFDLSSTAQTMALFQEAFVYGNPDGVFWDSSPWERLGTQEPDRSDPEELERFLQEYYQETYGISLQILRQEACYLVLFQSGESVFGLYYDPLLESYSGFGIQ